MNCHHSDPPKTQKQLRGGEDPSAYAVPAMESTTAGGLAIPTVIPAPAPASTVPVETAASTSAVPIETPATAEMRRRGQGGNIKKMRKRKVYDYDSNVHRVSSGSETDSD
ncbi:hypothetical protein BYT27DRAFT_7187459 [Phlegmacium glaucopus]|nr:hypothetical protein BYT27DRAFT_7187459 [Phlegmacium glaucopus]